MNKNDGCGFFYKFSSHKSRNCSRDITSRSTVPLDNMFTMSAWSAFSTGVFIFRYNFKFIFKTNRLYFFGDRLYVRQRWEVRGMEFLRFASVLEKKFHENTNRKNVRKKKNTFLYKAFGPCSALLAPIWTTHPSPSPWMIWMAHEERSLYLKKKLKRGHWADELFLSSPPGTCLVLSLCYFDC